MSPRSLAPWVLALTITACYAGLDTAGGPADGGLGESTGGEGPDGDDPEGLACETGEIGVGESRLARLTRTEYDNAIRALLGDGAPIDSGRLTLSDGSVGPFSHNADTPVAEETVEDYRGLAEELATWAVDQIDTIAHCDPQAASCPREFIERFGRLAYRRALEPDEVDRLVAVYETGAESGVADGFRLAIATILQSPHFLYRIEIGTPSGIDGIVALSGMEIASRLSFFLWKAPPDEALLTAAAAGELDDPQGLQAQATRMIDDPRAMDTMVSFHTEWLGVEQVSELERDPGFAEFDATLWDDMREQMRRFTQDVLRDGDGRLQTLLTASHAPATPALGRLYGIDGMSEGWSQVELDPTRRAGLLTMPAFLAVTSHADQTTPVLRGLAVRERVLCTPPPPPPPSVANSPPEVDPSLPTRERFDQHRTDPACAGCHNLMDPLGYGFELYDPIGRYRTTDGAFEVDARGEVVGTTDIDGPFDGAVELAQRLATSDQVRECVQRQMFRFAAGRSPTDDDTCSERAAHEAFAAGDFTVRDLMIALTASDAFRYRRIAAEEFSDDSH